jgi:hypothetical protein
MPHLRWVNPPTNFELTTENNEQFLQIEDGIVIAGHDQDFVGLVPGQPLPADAGLAKS